MTTSQERRINLAIQKIEKLTGERAKGEQRALLRSDFAAVRKITVPKVLAAPAAGSPPTKAEFDALVADVKALRGVLVAIIAGL